MDDKNNPWGSRDPYYTLDKLRKALGDFNEAEGTLPERLYESWFQIHLLTVDDFPLSLQFDFCELIRKFTERRDPTPQGTPGRIGDARNTINMMPASECLHIVGLITDLIGKVERSIGESHSIPSVYLTMRPPGAA